MSEKICLIGLGYVGLPLACLLSKNFSVSGFDINPNKIKDLVNGIDETREVDNLSQYKIQYSADPAIIKEATFVIIAVPTPIDDNHKPDLTPVVLASEIVGRNLAKGAVVVYESTVYPGCTEEICLPILEKESGLKFGQDFTIGYSPERINPGDRVHTIDKITKVISASDKESLVRVEKVYSSFTKTYTASSIKVAEASKVIENVQRSLNIALMNELALIFDKLGISTKEVIDAAATKWNFHKYGPGLVGGHCIGVDPYYLTYKAQQVGYEPQVILSGQSINEYMSEFVASKLAGANKVLVMGLTFKENVPDTRNSKAFELILKLKAKGVKVFGFDPMLNQAEFEKRKDELSLISDWPPKEKFNAIIVFSPHDTFKDSKFSLANLIINCEPNPVIFDIKGFYNKTEAEMAGFKYLTL